jgi:hypothetical protein
VLEFLLTKPRATYLARVRNPNPAMPDAMRNTLELPGMWRTGGNHLERIGAGRRRGGEGGRPLMAPRRRSRDLEVHGPPPELEREPLVANNRSLGWISDQVAASRRAARRVVVGGVCSERAGADVPAGAMLVYQISTGVGVWGNNHPVMWGWDIINFVWWIGIGHAGTLISAILFLLRQRWRTGGQPRRRGHDHLRRHVRRHLSRPMHVGRVWWDWWLFPIPNSNAHLAAVPVAADVGRVRRLDLFHGVAAVLVHGLIPTWRCCATGRRRSCGSSLRPVRLGWTGSNRHWSNYEKAYLILAGLSTPLVLSVHSIVSLDFAVSQLPGWHTTIFPPYFVAGRDLLRVRHGADAADSAAQAVQAGGHDHDAAHRFDVQGDAGDGFDRGLRLR